MINTDNGEVGADTIFHYHQSGNVVSAEYRGGSIDIAQWFPHIFFPGRYTSMSKCCLYIQFVCAMLREIKNNLSGVVK